MPAVSICASRTGHQFTDARSPSHLGGAGSLDIELSRQGAVLLRDSVNHLRSRGNRRHRAQIIGVAGITRIMQAA